MNAVSPCTAVDPVGWDEIIRAVNCWRGAAIQCFAQAEAAVSETLLLMETVNQPEGKPKLRRLVGQRFEDLRNAIGPGGPFAELGHKAAAALAGFQPHEHHRAILCHGTARIAVDRRGEWIVVLRIIDFKATGAGRLSVTFDRREAEQMLDEISQAGRHLIAALQSLRAKIAPAPKPIASLKHPVQPNHTLPIDSRDSED